MTDIPTTSETILASAAGETDPKTLSNAAVTEDVLSPGAVPQDASKGEVLSFGGAVPAAPPVTADVGLTDRVSKLEADLAFLRKMFGWPEHTH